MDDNTYTTKGAAGIMMANAMGIYHFKVAAPQGMTTVSGLNIYGRGICGSVDVDIKDGSAQGGKNSNNFNWNVPSDTKSGTGSSTLYDIYYVAAPGQFEPTFELVDNSWNVDNGYDKAGLDKAPLSSHYSRKQALIANAEGEINRFTARTAAGKTIEDGKIIKYGQGANLVYNFTKGNMQYAFGSKIASLSGAKLESKRNVLSRLDGKKSSAAIAKTINVTTSAGHYRLASKQWEVLTPVNYRDWWGGVP